MKRSSFIKQSGILATGLGLSKFVRIAGPFTLEDFSGNIAPINKKLDKDWIQFYQTLRMMQHY